MGCIGARSFLLATVALAAVLAAPVLAIYRECSACKCLAVSRPERHSLPGTEFPVCDI